MSGGQAELQKDDAKLQSRHSAHGSKISLSLEEMLLVRDADLLRILQARREAYVAEEAAARGIKADHPWFVRFGTLSTIISLAVALTALLGTFGQSAILWGGAAAFVAGMGIGLMADVLTTRGERKRRSAFARSMLRSSGSAEITISGPRRMDPKGR